MNITHEAAALLKEAVALAEKVETHGKGLTEVTRGIKRFPTHGVQSLRIEAQALLKKGGASAEELSGLVGLINEQANNVLTLKPHNEGVLEKALNTIEEQHNGLTSQISDLAQESKKKWVDAVTSPRGTEGTKHIAPKSNYLQQIERGGRTPPSSTQR